ncbi:aspartyl-phosphate phosphatase Spo0E family protein [Ornithinibacillus gellani]|uniref:aspartyl-phosphate phosphatase Spo0E family protein n=1 Tax=Ornithinibacillus gellani TaxID=2293253 RepID=UPI000F4AE723|nr:aspartyl-phosphate phosphatase Spo0E family protein [Ornithinibacillus gellani]TQS75725.1 aspartyl-phosphate phosphatase Spo0E family protein [Ornithinibacillus gellani]
MKSDNKLLHHIEHLRNKMTSIALDKGLSSAESLAISQELDRLLNKYDEEKAKK